VLFSDSQSVTAWTKSLRGKAFGPRESVHAAQLCCIALGCISWFYSVFLDQCLTYSSTSSFSFISIYHALNAMGESLSPLLIEADDRLTRQEIACYLWNRNVHCTVHNSHILSWTIWIHFTASHYIYSGPVLISVHLHLGLRSILVSLLQVIWPECVLYIFHLRHVLLVLSPW
jgi:hypothetical protein